MDADPIMIKSATFRLKSAYGQVRAYPVNTEAKLLCDLTGSKTLLPQSISTIVSLGFNVVDDASGQPIVPSVLF